jgi:hypothetical protein
VYYVIITGPAGSGKSTLTDSLASWLEDNQMSVTKVNFDPAAEVVPYVPDVDVRRYVNARDLMVEKGLGPNGALILSVDLLINHIEEIKEEIEETRSNYVLVDLPGQLEVIAFRRIGPILIKELVKGSKAVNIFLLDSRLSMQPSSAMASLLLSLSTLYRLELPQVLAINKVDLVINGFSSTDIGEELSKKIYLLKMLDESFSCSDVGYSSMFIDSEISIKLCESIREIFNDIIPVSASTGYGIDSLYASIQRSLAGGEDYLTEEPSGML